MSLQPQVSGPAGSDRAGEGQTPVVLGLERSRGLLGVQGLFKNHEVLTLHGYKQKHKELVGSGGDPGPRAEGKCYMLSLGLGGGRQ